MRLPRDAVIDRGIRQAVSVFRRQWHAFETDAAQLRSHLLGSPELGRLTHSMKWRAKAPDSLLDSLRRKAQRSRSSGEPFDVTGDNVFDVVPDLAGVRLLHLHTRQFLKIHPLLLHVFSANGYVFAEPPQAKTWDLEHEQMFRRLGLKVERDESLYTSVHYVLKHPDRGPRRCELQVRTLAEEIWGEVSHTINYPRPTDSVACREQLKALARVVSGCSRLVDSIFASFDEAQRLSAARAAQRTARRKPRDG